MANENTLDRNKKNTKSQFATYLNMAYDNFMSLTSHIVVKYGLRYKPKEDAKKESDKETNKVEAQFVSLCNALKGTDTLLKSKLQEEIKQNLPFFEDLCKDMKKTYEELLASCRLTLLNNRNKSSHGSRTFIPNDKQLANIRAEEFIIPLRNTFEAARRVIKQRFSYAEGDMYFLTKDSYIVKKDKKKKNVKENPDFFYSFRVSDDAGDRLSDTGLVFFICLFLEKKYVRMFLENTLFKEMRFGAIKEQNIIYEIFACYRMRQVREKLNCEKDNTALGLDMINEPHKCPKELFELLSPQDQKQFRIKSSDANLGDVLMVRSHDRFPYFAMRYIDDSGLFKKTRFQVALGNYRYKFYPKNCIDGGEPRLRSLQKEVNGFGRLQEIEERRKNEYKSYIRETIEPDDAATQPYMTDCHAHYIYNGNRVAISLQGDYLPMINEDKAPCRQPDCWLSTFELPAVIFLLMLGGDPEKVISSHVEKLRKLYSDIISGAVCPELTPEDLQERYNLKPTFIPIKIRQYLDGKPFDNEAKFNKHSEAMLLAMKKETLQQIERVNSRREKAKELKRGKKGSEGVKAGWLAQVLAKDIIAMQPSHNNGRDKLTGLNFSIMQASLALYDHDKVKRIFTSANMIGGSNKHPFLEKVMKKEYRDIFEFHAAYMAEKIAYLDKRIIKESYGSCAFLHKNAAKWATRDEQYYKDLAKRYLDQPVELPRGLFNDDIKKQLEEFGNPAINHALSQELCNVNYMIKTYFEAIRHDHSQKFYSYQLAGLQTLHDKKESNDVTEEEAIHIKNKIRNKEKQIRQFSIQDMLVLMMAEKIIFSKDLDKTNPTKMKLSDIGSPESNILNMPLPFKVKIKTPDGKETEVYQDDMKIKDYGLFLNLLYDKRVKTLLGKLREREVERQELKEELDNFDKVTPDVHRCIDEFEDRETDGLTTVDDIKRKYGNNKSPQFKFIVEKSSMPDEYQVLLNELRNVFSHRYYPEANNDLSDLYEQKSLPEIAKYMEEKFKQTIN